ncbi:MAG: ATP-binding protein [bacterium]
MKFSFNQKILLLNFVILIIGLLAICTQINMMKRYVFMTAFIVILLVLLINYLCLKILTRPITQISVAAKKISEGDFSGKLDITSPDEIGELAKAFNMMSDKLSTNLLGMVRRENELKSILNSMTEGVLAVDTSRKVILVNMTMGDIFGFDIRDVIGRYVYEMVRHDKYNDIIKNVIDCEIPQEEELHFAVEDKIFQIHVVPLKGENKTVVGALAVLNDITKIRRLEIIRKDFVANVTHELKTPLTAISGYAETLLDGALKDVRNRRSFVQKIKNQSDRLGSLIDDILELSQIESGRKEFEIGKVAIQPLVDKVIDDLHERIKKKKIKVGIELPDDLSYVKCDTRELEAIINNLLDNAIKYTPSGGKISIIGQESAKYVRISISDTGVGIPGKDIPRLFERFYRVDKARSRELGGTGLGLSIVKHLVEAQGGEVAVESTIGQGSTFSFTLQIATKM